MTTQAIEALDPITEELIGIAAAVASQCECCFTDHYNEALDLGGPLQSDRRSSRLGSFGLQTTPKAYRRICR